jgi:hypothetical protein
MDPGPLTHRERQPMKSRANKVIGTKVRLSPDGPVGVIINVASHEQRPLVQVRFEDGDVWAPRGDTVPADEPSPEDSAP